MKPIRFWKELLPEAKNESFTAIQIKKTIALSRSKTGFNTSTIFDIKEGSFVCLVRYFECDYELLKPGQSITAEIYCAQLDRLKAELLKKTIRSGK